VVRQYSAALGSSVQAFKDKGIFNGFIEIDSKLYIDPHLLEKSSARELRQAGKGFRKYFADTIKILKKASDHKSVFWRQALSRLTFREISQIGLGYSINSVRGSAIGPKLAWSITQTAREIVMAGIDDPEVFELIGLLEEGIGADRISDMTASVIIDYLLLYSQRIGKELRLRNQDTKFHDKSYKLPFDQKTGRSVILLPSDILRNLPIAHDWSDIDIVCRHNEQLRNQVNQIIGRTWRKATKKLSKRDLRDALLYRPAVLQDLIDQYKDKVGAAYDFKADPAGEFIWYSAAQDYVSKYPLDLSGYVRIKAEQVFPLVEELCLRFKQLVEHNGLYELFYNDSRRLRNERAAQLLFFGVADAYCQANNIDINRESNAGKGPVDFKISYGYDARVTVEMKYSSNGNLLKAYNQAEKTTYSIFLVIQTGSHKKKLADLHDIYKTEKAAGRRVPEIIIVSGQRQASASHLRRKR
jgi:hypothetical protein